MKDNVFIQDETINSYPLTSVWQAILSCKSNYTELNLSQKHAHSCSSEILRSKRSLRSSIWFKRKWTFSWHHKRLFRTWVHARVMFEINAASQWLSLQRSWKIDRCRIADRCRAAQIFDDFDDCCLWPTAAVSESFIVLSKYLSLVTFRALHNICKNFTMSLQKDFSHKKPVNRDLIILA